MGLPLSECLVTPVYSWRSFTESEYHKRKLPLENGGSGHTVLIFRVLGQLSLPAVKEVSIADGPAAGALEQVGYSKEMKPESQRLNTLYRILLLYSLCNKLCFVNNTQKSANEKISQMVSLFVSAVHSMNRFVLQIWLYCSIKRLVYFFYLLQSGTITLSLSVCKQSLDQEPFAPFAGALRSKGIHKIWKFQIQAALCLGLHLHRKGLTVHNPLSECLFEMCSCFTIVAMFTML